MRSRLRLAAVPTLLLALLVGLAVAATPAAAGDPESIRSYDVAITIHASGVISVTETIAYDFGSNERHGIFRYIPIRFSHYDDHHDRVYPISDISVSRDGKDEKAAISTDGDFKLVKIGDPDRTISGVHTYVIRYDMAYTINTFPEDDELYWNAVGDQWPVPVQQASVTVDSEAAITAVTCYSGPDGSNRPCDFQSFADRQAKFTDSDIAAYSGFTVVVALPPGSIANPGPKLDERWSFASAFRPTPWTLGGGGLLLLIGAGAALLVAYLHGRDRHYVGILPGLTPERDDPVVEQRKPFIGAPPVSVEFTPPGDLRPGQVGTLIDEQANVVDVTATIVDFAVRKHLRIRELNDGGKYNTRDWELVKLTDGDPRFLPYERRLFDALFSGRDKVRLSQLRYTFASELASAQSALYRDMVEQGWYRQSPARTRAVAYAAGVAILLGSIAITVLLAIFTHAALVGVGLVLASVVLLLVAGRFPARTGKGSAVLARVQGFRLYIATAEKDQIAFQEREEIFSRYLPYAMVFGLVDRWATIFSDLASRPDTSGLYWYTGAPGWSMLYFGASIGAFTTQTTGTIAAQMPSSSSSSGGSGVFGGSGFGGGFSGGGAGGGGGGSW